MAGKLRSEEISPYRSILVARFDEGQALSAEKVLRKLKRVLGVRVQVSRMECGKPLLWTQSTSLGWKYTAYFLIDLSFLG